MKQYIIDEEVLRGIFSYLVSRPYQEVFQGIQALQQLKELEVTEEKNEE